MLKWIFIFFFNYHLQSTSKLIKTDRQISVRLLNVSKIELSESKGFSIKKSKVMA